MAAPADKPPVPFDPTSCPEVISAVHPDQPTGFSYRAIQAPASHDRCSHATSTPTGFAAARPGRSSLSPARRARDGSGAIAQLAGSGVLLLTVHWSSLCQGRSKRTPDSRERDRWPSR
jgi:hypothetical protein